MIIIPEKLPSEGLIAKNLIGMETRKIPGRPRLPLHGFGQEDALGFFVSPSPSGIYRRGLWREERDRGPEGVSFFRS
jgi:hypothetical protein